LVTRRQAPGSRTAYGTDEGDDVTMRTTAGGRSQILRTSDGNKSIVLPGLLLGVGLGGFVDGILLHQILQWHHMRSGDGIGGDRSLKTVGGLEANTIADGVFHTATWLLVVVGLYMLWNRSRDAGRIRSWTELTGLLLVGWGAFNLVEGIIDHQILGIHHLRDDEGGPIGWDLGFLAFGFVLVLAGVGLARRGAREGEPAAG
jgi:uncharacterized membrane protein